MLFQGLVTRAGYPALTGVLTILSAACYAELMEMGSTVTGDLTIIAVTTGLDRDSDGYTVTVDGTQSQTVLNNGAAGFAGLPVGDHVVELTGIAANCTVDQNRQVVTVNTGEIAQATFTITCVTSTGVVEIAVSTTGTDLDTDGYTVGVDGSPIQPVAGNATVSISGLSAADHTVALTGVASNCGVDQNPQTITVVAASTVSIGFAVRCVDRGPVFSAGLWTSVEELAALPMSGSAWNELRSAATGSWGRANVRDQDNDHDVLTFAGALYAERTDDETMRARVRAAIDEAVGTEAGGRTLALARQLLGYVIAADLISYRAPAFVAWVDAVRTTRLEGRAGIDNLFDSAMQDPSNWGCHARAAMIAAARYLGDSTQLALLAGRLQDYLGRSGSGFRFGELWWQADPSRPVGINPVGATITGVNVDGVIPDDQRRGGRFKSPPPRENYVWESLQGTVAAVHLLGRAGYPTWEWEDRAILRAASWLHNVADYPADGDDSWIPWRINAAYGTSFPASTGRPLGKNVGFTSWTHR